MSGLVEGCGWCSLSREDAVHRGATIFAHVFVAPLPEVVAAREGWVAGVWPLNVDSPLGSSDPSVFFVVVDRWRFVALCPIGGFGCGGVPVEWVQLMNERWRLPFHAGWWGSCGCVVSATEWELVASRQVHVSGVSVVVDFVSVSRPRGAWEGDVGVVSGGEVPGSDCGWCGRGVDSEVHVGVGGDGLVSVWFHEYVAPSVGLVELRVGLLEGGGEVGPEYLEVGSPLRGDLSGFFVRSGSVLEELVHCPAFVEHSLGGGVVWEALCNPRVDPVLFVGWLGSCGCFLPAGAVGVIVVEGDGDGDEGFSSSD